ncbi:MAG: helix-turn-helix domain-containing protein [Gordonibacter sp.]|nr:helix-turn-helix domain-containing protein [Gordonibacter sp.]
MLPMNYNKLDTVNYGILDRRAAALRKAVTTINYSEKLGNNSEKRAAYIPPQTIPEMFDPQIRCMHTVEASIALQRGFARTSDIRSVGRTWFIDPAFGMGYYWYLMLDNQTAIVSMDMKLNVDVELCSDTMDFLCIGLYGKSMPDYFLAKPVCRDEVLFGYTWRSKPYRQVIRANDELKSTSITFTLQAAVRYAEMMGCTPCDLVCAIGNLKGDYDVVGLPCVLKSISSARPGKRYAAAFYRSKIAESLALLLDKFDYKESAESTVPTVDEVTVREGCSYIENHLSANLSTKHLSSILHVSERKLIDAFKRIKEMTPQSYIRKLRIDHARSLLIDQKDASIRAIARQVGYANQGSFTDAFRQEVGCTPSEYRLMKAL